MEHKSMIKEIKGGFTERLRLENEYYEWLKKERETAHATIMDAPQTFIVFLETLGWRQVGDDAVVMTKEELIELNEKGFTFDTTTGGKINLIEMAREQARKEAAREILQEIANEKNKVEDIDTGISYYLSDEHVRQLAKKYGVKGKKFKT